jgi:hypothetical protein
MKSGTKTMNRTGLSAAPDVAEAALESTSIAKPSSKGGLDELDAARKPYIAEHEPIGSPPPGRGKQIPDAFMDKLGERLAFERGGTRLYQLMLGKLRANGRVSGGPSVADVEHIMNEELDHFRLITSCIEQLGGDPTVVTPSADLTGVASTGLVQIMSDPRTTVPQCLQALLMAELTDHDGWEMLVKMAEGLGHDEIASQFNAALGSEQEHLESVRGWIATTTGQEAGMKVMPRSPSKSASGPNTRGQTSSSTRSGARRGAKAK